jgi:hypothetical protein
MTGTRVMALSGDHVGNFGRPPTVPNRQNSTLPAMLNSTVESTVPSREASSTSPSGYESGGATDEVSRSGSAQEVRDGLRAR